MEGTVLTGMASSSSSTSGGAGSLRCAATFPFRLPSRKRIAISSTYSTLASNGDGAGNFLQHNTVENQR